MNEELKPCPNPDCVHGSPRINKSPTSSGGCDIVCAECVVCSTRGPFAFSVEGAEKWNSMPRAERSPLPRGTRVRKISGSEWKGVIVGEYSTNLTPEGYAVESESHAGSVQIYPRKALEVIP